MRPILVLLLLVSVCFAETTVRIGYFDKYPVSFKNSSGKADGLTADIMKDIAADEHWKIIWIHGTFSQCVDRLRKHEIDLMIPIGFSKERTQEFSFSEENILQTWGCLFTLRGSGVESLPDTAGRKIAYIKNTMFLDQFKGLINNFNIECSYIETNGVKEMLDCVLAGKADGGLGDRLAMTLLTPEEQQKINATIVFNPFTLKAAALKGEADNIISVLDRYIAESKNNPEGKYRKNLNFWLSGQHDSQTNEGILAFFMLLLFGVFGIYTATRFSKIRRFLGMTEIVEAHVAQNVLIVSGGIAILLLMTDIFLEYFWFNLFNQSLYRVIFPLNNPHEIITRILYCGVTLLGGITVSVVLSKLSGEQEKARELAENLRITFDSIGDGVIVTDISGSVIRMNPVAEAYTGFSNEEAAGNSLEQIFRIVNAFTREIAFNPVERVINTGEISGLANHTVLISKNGKEYQIADSAAPIHDDSGSITGIVLVFRDVTEKYAQEQRIKENEERFQKMLSVVPDLVSIHAPDGTILYSNWSGFGAVDEKKRLIGAKCFETYHGNTEFCTNCKMKQAFLEHKNCQSEICLSDNIWIDMRMIPFFDKDGNPEMCMEWARDITERKNYETELAKEKDRLDYILHGTNAGTWEWNVQTGETVFNERWAEIIGYSLADISPTTVKTWENYTHPDDLKHSIELLEKHFSNELGYYECEARMKHKNGHWVWVLDRGMVTVRDKNNKPLLMYGTHLDITELKNTEEELRKTRNYIANIINSMPSVLIGVDAQGNITHWNSRAEEIYKLNFEDVQQKKITDIMVSELSFNEIQESIQERKVKNFSRKIIQDGGNTRCDDITVFPLITNGVEGAVIRIDDVTRQWQMEMQLNQSRKLDAIGQLAGGVAHDFNNMLGGIMGAAELIKMESITPDAKEYIDLILQTAERAGELTRKMLAFSRKGISVMTVIDAEDVVQDAVSILERTIDKKITIHTSYDAENTRVNADAVQLQNIFINLGINADHAMASGGELNFSLKNTVLEEEYCSASHFELTPGDYLVIEVRDTGCGIAPEHMGKIFEPFFTTKEQGKGTGLGLAAVYGIVRDHHGAITVYSELNRGTVFQVFLPVSDAVKSVSHKDEEVITGSGCILLADDEEIIRITAQAILKKLNYLVILAKDGKEAVDIYKKRKNEINLVILDMIMPVMDGHRAFSELKRIDPDVKIVLSSGFSRDEDISKMREKGLCGFIKKPYKKSELSRMIAEILI